MYREKTGILFLLCALVLPAAILSDDVIVSGSFMAFFLLVLAILTIRFLMDAGQGFYEWYSFWGVIVGAVYMLGALTGGRSTDLEVAGFVLFVAYLISGFFFILKSPESRGSYSHKRQEIKAPEAERDEYITIRPSQSDLSDDEIEHFRRKDELSELADIIPDAPKEQSKLHEYEDFRREKISAASEEEDIEWDESAFTAGYERKTDRDGYYEIKAEADFTDEEPYSTEGYIELYPDSKARRPDPARRRETLVDSPKVKVVELKEAPQIDLEKLRESARELDLGVSRINERIKLIAEKAILEGAEKRLETETVERKRRSLISEKKSLENAAKKLKEALGGRPAPVSSQEVYASETGTRYHYNDKCLSLKRVKKKDMVIFNDSKEARKQGLRACERCKR